MDFPGYQVLEQIGRGGMATVYLAIHEALNRKVALKVLEPFLTVDASFRERFLREGRTLAYLSHRHIVTIYDIDCCDSRYFISMEYLKGGDLKQRIKKQLSVGCAIEIAKQVASALNCAHKNEIVHRDVKPGNILFREDGSTVLSDFGIAKNLEAQKDLTTTGHVIGSLKYMSPEQALGQPIDACSDLYSLGVVLFEMLTGKLPHENEPSFAPATLPNNSVVAELPEGLRHYQPILNRLLAKDRTARFSSVDQFLDALELVDEEIDSNPTETVSSAITQERQSITKTVTLPSTDLSQQNHDEAAIDPDSPTKNVKTKLWKLTVAAVLLGGFFAAFGWLQYQKINTDPVPVVDPAPAPVSPYKAALQKAKARADRAQEDADKVKVSHSDPLYENSVNLLNEAENASAEKDALDSYLLAEAAFVKAKRSGTRVFLAGSTEEEIQNALSLCRQYVSNCSTSWYASEKAREVKLNPFSVDLSEVTNSQFAEFVKGTGYVTEAQKQGFSYTGFGLKKIGYSWKSPKGPDSSYLQYLNHPVGNISRADAEAYCSWKKGRLPSENEWEYIARGTERSVFAWGNSWQPEGFVENGKQRSTLPIGSHPEWNTPSGIMDVAGSVWEWTATTVNGKGILKGGSWHESNPANLRAATSRESDLSKVYIDDGFRCIYDQTNWPDVLH